MVGWGQQVATGQQESPPPGTYAIKQQGESFISEIAEPMNSKLVKSKVMCANVTVTQADLFLGSLRRTRLVGVTSHAYDMSDCNETGGVDTRIQFYRDWIESKMVAGCETGVRVWCDEPGILEPNYFEKLEAEAAEEDKGLFACSTSGFGWSLSPMAIC